MTTSYRRAPTAEVRICDFDIPLRVQNVCREDREHAYVCKDENGQWKCENLPPVRFVALSVDSIDS
jgi:hypothetical protein